MNEFINVKPLWACIQNVLPQVYDDTLGYQELLYKVISKLNELVENNNKLPNYIADLIKQYISSGEIEKVLAEVMATYMLNVKFPPAGLTPASGDGTADDTEAVQGCIDYAASHGGMAVYFPSGSYLCGSLHVGGKCTMFGYDRYNTRIVMRGGVTEPLLSGNVEELSLNGLGFDGNMDIQVNNVNLIDITVVSGVVTNVFLTDGYDLLKANVTGDLTVSDVVFNHAVEHSLVVEGTGTVVVADCVFNTVSELIGKRYIKLGVNNSSVNGVVMKGACPVGVEVTGNNNRVQFNKGQCVKGFVDSGAGNTIIVDGVERQEKYTDNVSVECDEYSRKSGVSDNINVLGNRKVTVGGDVVESCMVKTDSVTNKRTVKSGSVDDSTTGDRAIKSKNVTETVDADSVEVVSGDKNLSAGSVHVSGGMIDVNVQGVKNEVVTGDVSEDYRAGKTVTVGGDKTETVAGVWQETANGKKVEDCNGNVVRHIVGTLNDSVDGIVNTLYKASEIKIVTGSSSENVSKTKQISAEAIKLNASDSVYYDSPSKDNHLPFFDVVGFKSNPGGVPYNVLVKNAETDDKFNTYDGYSTSISNINTNIQGINQNINELNSKIENLALLPFANVKEFGAKGDGSTDDTSAIQAALDSQYSLVYLPGGVYMVNTLKCPSDKIIVGAGATLKNLNSDAILINKADGVTGDYYANGNITVYNVKFDANNIASSSIGFGHVNRCRIYGCTFIRNPMWHCIELNAAYDCEIVNCHFSQYSTNPEIVEQSSEMIQLDAALNTGVFPWFGPYDKKGCEFIKIVGNMFNNVAKSFADICKNPEKYCAIGNHSPNQPNQETAKRVLIANNMFINMGRCVAFCSGVGIDIVGNFGDNIACFFFARNTTDRNAYINISNNYVYCNQVGVESGYAEKIRCINTSGGNKDLISDISVIGNQFYNSGGHGIAVNGSNITIANNRVRCGTLTGQTGLYMGYDVTNCSYMNNDVNSAIYNEGSTTPTNCLISGNHFYSLKFNRTAGSGTTFANNISDTASGTMGSTCKCLNDLRNGTVVPNQNV